MEIIVKDFNVNWLDIKNACRQTVSMGDSKIEPNEEWKKKLLICRHSPLRIGNVLLQLNDIPFYVMGHLVRHNVGVVPFVSTSREDRTNISRDERKQTDLVSMQLLVNVEAILNISERRLCTCADKETIKVWKEVLLKIKELDEALYWASVPQCIAHGGCIEPFSECSYYDNIMQDATLEEQRVIKKRYDYYNRKRKGE